MRSTNGDSGVDGHVSSREFADADEVDPQRIQEKPISIAMFIDCTKRTDYGAMKFWNQPEYRDPEFPSREEAEIGISAIRALNNQVSRRDEKARELVFLY